MADTKAPDFGDMWRDMVVQWERGVNEFAGQAMKTTEFSRGMNQANVSLALMQKTFADAMSRYLASLNLPSRADLAEISGRLEGIERNLERLAAALPGTANGEQAVTAFRPARTRQPRPPGPETEAVP